MVTNIIKTITSTKAIIGFIAIILSGVVYSFDKLHDKFITKSDLTLRFNHYEIAELQNKIIDLQINRGYAINKSELMRFDTLIKVKESQILKYRQY